MGCAKTDVPIIVIVDSIREIPQVMQKGDSPLTVKQYLHKYGFDVDEAGIHILSRAKAAGRSSTVPVVFIGHTLHKELIPGDKIKFVTRTSTVDNREEHMDHARDCFECQSPKIPKAPKRMPTIGTWARVTLGKKVTVSKAVKPLPDELKQALNELHDQIINDLIDAFKNS